MQTQRVGNDRPLLLLKRSMLKPIYAKTIYAITQSYWLDKNQYQYQNHLEGQQT